jgi:hypothetical protein
MLSPADILAHAVTASDFCTQYGIEAKYVTFNPSYTRVQVITDLASMRVAFAGHDATVTRSYGFTRYTIVFDAVTLWAEEYTPDIVAAPATVAL